MANICTHMSTIVLFRMKDWTLYVNGLLPKKNHAGVYNDYSTGFSNYTIFIDAIKTGELTPVADGEIEDVGQAKRCSELCVHLLLNQNLL